MLRDKNDVQTKLEDVEEDYAELLKKYRAAVQQLSVEHTTIQEQSRQIEQLCSEKEALNEQVHLYMSKDHTITILSAWQYKTDYS